MRVADALRVCALVVAGVTSGYLWRAAFESSEPPTRAAAPLRVVERVRPIVVRIPVRVTAEPSKRAAPAQRKSRRVRTRPVAAVVAVRAVRPAVATARPARRRPAPRKPAPPKVPASPVQAPTPAPTSAATATSTVASLPAATTQPPVAAPPATPASTPDQRPGWGKGDKNHEHSGPPNKSP